MKLQGTSPRTRRLKQNRDREARRRQQEAVERLRDELRAGRLAICVGSGVTLFSASTQMYRLSVSN